MAILSVPPWSRRVSLPALLRKTGASRPLARAWRDPRKLTRFSAFTGSFQVPRIPNPAANPIPAPIRIRFQLTAFRIVLLSPWPTRLAVRPVGMRGRVEGGSRGP